jgi:hypothetical protein
VGRKSAADDGKIAKIARCARNERRFPGALNYKVELAGFHTKVRHMSVALPYGGRGVASEVCHGRTAKKEDVSATVNYSIEVCVFGTIDCIKKTTFAKFSPRPKVYGICDTYGFKAYRAVRAPLLSLSRSYALR